MRTMIFDTESTDLKAIMGRLLCGSFAYLTVDSAGRSKVGKPWTVSAEDHPGVSVIDDSRLAVAIRDELEKADMIVGWNSKLHDIPLIQARLALAGERPVHVRLHCDIMWYAGGSSMKIGSRKLDNVAKFFALKSRKCVSAETPILMSDLRWREAGTLAPGDSVLAFDEDGPLRAWKHSTVIGNQLRTAKVMRVRLDSGREVVTTPDHPWLVSGGDAAEWVQTQGLEQRGEVYVNRPVTPWTVNRSREAQWLGTFLNAEGTSNAHGTIAFKQHSGPTLERATSALSRLGFRFTTQTTILDRGLATVTLLGGHEAVFRLLGTVRPERLITQWQTARLSQVSPARRERVAALSPGDPCGQIANLTTSSNTYVADGFMMHNTALDWPTWQKAGAGDQDALKLVIKHCEYDVKVLGEAFPHLIPFVRNVHR